MGVILVHMAVVLGVNGGILCVAPTFHHLKAASLIEYRIFSGTVAVVASYVVLTPSGCNHGAGVVDQTWFEKVT